MNASIYSSNGAMIYQHGNSRTIVSKTGALTFEVKRDGVWLPGRQRYAALTLERVKALLAFS
jgi:hypothetical protein